MKKELNFLEPCLQAAAKVLLSHWDQTLDIKKKPDTSLVTQADLASEKVILDRIRTEYPNDLICSEEFGLSASLQPNRHIWIIDPLDGTTNFANRYPCFCVSIARGLIQKDLSIQLEVGGIINPIHQKLYLGAAGHGATVNGKKLQTSPQRPFEDTFLVTGFYVHKDDILRREVERFYRVANRCSAVRRDGSAALNLAMVAEGVFDGFWEFGLKPWDMAAGVILIREAKGKVVNYGVKPDSAFDLEKDGIIAGSEAAVKELIELI